MDVKEVLYMSKGGGENSYARLSTFTQMVTSIAKPVLQNAVQSLFSKGLHQQKVLNIADMGCSAGPNTFSVMSTVKESVENKCQEMNCQMPELQFYLNDLPGNDFNTLFQGLPSFCDRSEGASCYAMGVPGSFYGRLLPRNTLHLAYSSYSVHWLSQGLIDEEKFDFFNVPYYTASPEEVENIVERERSFAIENLEIFALEVGDNEEKDKWAKGEKVAKRIRSFSESFVSYQFGEEIMDKLYHKFTHLVVEDLAKDSTKGTSIIVMLSKIG